MSEWEEDHLVLPVSHPAPASMGLTGYWRNFKPVIDQGKCIRCLLCWLFCPEGTIIRHEDNSVSVDYDYCKGCGVCANECPVNAIKMVPEGEEQ